ncbi:hypothetical protein [Chamaesiphon sp. OTE_75_metabat_556]|uniref:hypothetical protein n=1 Tax=Chamaesiphon sp. OTE_75_metabat_556 TaxID=2964692 RepID=UPI00286C70E1|nr:hypothetical protein [Chamaesiphon sp. OTE_75_metabat_556]
MTFPETLLVSGTTAFLTGTFTLIVQYFVASLQRRNEKDKALEQEKRTAYKQLLDLVFNVLGSIANDKNPSNKTNDENDIFKIERDLTVYASDEVFQLFLALRKASDENQNVVEALAKLILAIRKDSGHKNTAISLREILSPVVRNPGKLFENL